MPKTISAVTLGCKVNQYDTNAMLDLFRISGYEVVPWGTTSDIALINTCTVTAMADKKSRNLIRQAAARGSAVCVCGCMAQKDGEDLRKLPGVRWLVGTSDRQRVVELVEAAQPGSLVGCRRGFEELRIRAPEGRTRGFIKIQEGCDNWCSYCIIPSVRGMPHARAAEDVVSEVRRLVDQGVLEIVLTGINLSSYTDARGTDLASLVERIQTETDLARLRLGSLEPGIFDERFVARLARSKILCPHFHISLQSGSARILAAMNRKYTPEDYLEEIQCLRRHFEDPAITTDVMTGFPGEDAEAFADTVLFVREADFSRLHVFPFSVRPGTKAADMPRQVPMDVRRSRATDLITLGERLAAAYARRQVGLCTQVLFEEFEDGQAVGYSDKYVRVKVPAGVPGTIQTVRLRQATGGELTGVVVQ